MPQYTCSRRAALKNLSGGVAFRLKFEKNDPIRSKFAV